jgi:hypothetical protein
MGEMTVPRQIFYAAVNKHGWIIGSSTRSLRRDVIEFLMGIERRYYPNAPHIASWAKTRKKWGYRIVRFVVEGPQHVS